MPVRRTQRHSAGYHHFSPARRQRPSQLRKLRLRKTCLGVATSRQPSPARAVRPTINSLAPFAPRSIASERPCRVRIYTHDGQMCDEKDAEAGRLMTSSIAPERRRSSHRDAEWTAKTSSRCKTERKLCFEFSSSHNNRALLKIFDALSKDTYEDICKYFGIRPIDEQICARQSKFYLRYCATQSAVHVYHAICKLRY